MKIKRIDLVRMHRALSALTEKAEEIKIPGEVWIAIAINKNALHPIAVAYELAASAARAEVSRRKPARSKDAAEDRELNGDEKLALLLPLLQPINDVEEEVKLKSVKLTDLKLEDNPQICGLLAEIAPMVPDLGK